MWARSLLESLSQLTNENRAAAPRREAALSTKAKVLSQIAESLPGSMSAGVKPVRWMDRLRVYVRLTRPFTLLPPTVGVLSGAVTAFGSAANPDPEVRLTLAVLMTVLLGSACAALLNAASNVINQVTDLEIDRINKPERPLPRGKISVTEASWLSAVLYALALIPTWLVVVYPYESFASKLMAPLAKHECILIYFLGMLFTFIYSVPALGRTKARGFLANMTIAIPRGCLLKVAGWSMVASIVNLEPWYIGSIFLLFIIGASSTKDFSDIEGDRAGGCRTLPVLYGPKVAAWISAPFFVFPWLLIPLGTSLSDPWHPGRTILTGHAQLLEVLSVLLVIWGFYVSWLMLRRPEDLAKTENHPSWVHMYLMMLTAQIGFALAYTF